MEEPKIIFSNGMGKSGSTLMTQYLLAMLARAVPNNGQTALREATRGGKLTGSDDFVERVDKPVFDLLNEIAARNGLIVVKVHCDTSPLLIEALRFGRIKMTFIHRDPRDTILSGIDHYTRSAGTDLLEYSSFEKALEAAHWWAQVACYWLSSNLAYMVRYTDLVSDPQRELAGVASYLRFDLSQKMLEAIVAKERAQRRYGLHGFNRGELHRYQAEMSEPNQAFVPPTPRQSAPHSRLLGLSAAVMILPYLRVASGICEETTIFSSKLPNQIGRSSGKSP